MKLNATLLLSLIMLLFAGCAKDDQPNPDQISQFTLQFENETISLAEGSSTPFAASQATKMRSPTDQDSARILLTNSLGSRIGPLPQEPFTNTLLVSFNQFTHNGFNILDPEFRSWMTNGLREFTRDGDREEGVGIIWFDAAGTLWATGRDIGELGIFGEFVIPADVFPIGEDYQRDSRFSVLSKRIEAKPGFDFAQQVEITFNCTLYNEFGDSLEIKNGVFETVVDFW
jgi:hypothetical protein